MTLNLKKIAKELEAIDHGCLRALLPNEAAWGDAERGALGDHRKALMAALKNQHPRAGFVMPHGVSPGKDEDGEDLPSVISIQRDFRVSDGWLVVCGLLTPLGSEVARAFAEQSA